MKKSFRLHFFPLLSLAVLTIIAMAPSLLASPNPQTVAPTAHAAPPNSDEVGYIDCHDHPENTQVLARAAKTKEVVASLPCGERFTIWLSSYFFSRIQT